MSHLELRIVFVLVCVAASLAWPQPGWARKLEWFFAVAAGVPLAFFAVLFSVVGLGRLAQKLGLLPRSKP